MVKKTFMTLLVSLLLFELSLSAASAQPTIAEDVIVQQSTASSAAAVLANVRSDRDQPPRIVSYQPSNQGMLVNLERPLLQFTFDDEVVKGSGDLILYESSTHKEVWRTSVSDQSVFVSDNDRTIAWSVGTTLQMNTSYYVYMDAGTFKGEDGDFAGQSGASGWTFSTLQRDTTAPSAVSFSPAPGQTNTSTSSDLSITFTEPVWANKGYITIKSITSGNFIEQIPVPRHVR